MIFSETKKHTGGNVATGNKTAGAAMLVTVFLFFTISIAIALSATVAPRSELALYRTLAYSKYSYVAAEAGSEDGTLRQIKGLMWSSPKVYELNGATSTITSIEVIPGTRRDFYATGVSDDKVRKLYTSVSDSVNGVFPYGAQIGEGGITMNNGVVVDGTGLSHGDIFSDGPIQGAPGVTVDGNIIVASGMATDTSAFSTTCQTDEEVGKVNSQMDYAQSFIIGTTSPVTLGKVSLKLRRTALTPTAAKPAYVKIVTDNAGQPSTTVLASESLVYSTIQTFDDWVDIRFTSPATVSPATTYWIVFDSGTGTSNTKHAYWCRSNSDVYADGSGTYKDDWSTAGAWSAALSGDLAFKVYNGGGISKLDSVTLTGTAKAETITNSTINGDAYYNSISGSTVGGAACPNASCYPGSPTPTPIPLPLTPAMISQWKNDALAGGTITGNCGSAGVPGCDVFPLTLGPKKINGDFELTNNETLTVSGTLHITGNFITSNNTLVKCAFEYLTNSCVVIVDGYVNVNNNGNFAGSGSSGSFIMVLTTKEGCVGTGTTVLGCGPFDSAIAIANNVGAALFYTAASMISISNNAMVTAVVGYKLDMTNNTSIIYDPLVQAITFVPRPSGASGVNINRWSEY